MPILGILASSRLNGYSLLQTFTSSGDFTVPSGITSIAVFLVGPGGNGANGTSGPGAGGAGGAGSPGIAFKDYSVSAGLVFPVTVGAPTGPKGLPSPSTFKTLISTIASSGYATGQGTLVAGSCTVPGFVSSFGAIGGNGGAARSTNGIGNDGTPGQGGSILTLNLDGLGWVSIYSGAGGPGGGGGGRSVGIGNTIFYGGFGAVNSGAIAGNGGFGRAASGSVTSPPSSSSGANASITAISYGTGGAGGGGGGYGENINTGAISISPGGIGSPGNPGIVYVYGK